MDHQVKKSFLLYFRDVRRDGDDIFRSPGETPVLFEKALEQILHVVEPGYHALLHRKDNLDV